MSVPRQRLLDLLKVQCNIFNTTYNPEALRLGNKILRQRLRGPSILAYYPRKVATLQDMNRCFPNWETLDEREEERLENLRIAKAKGKAAPKKKKTREESKKFKGKKR
ncbi:Mitochondrial 37S ribosomal protein S27 [Erysiphe neolycopersici]|uniref:Small ribosomal subunit protein mS33 n=1 Tax=Erysiphe neolycopersici TaxID=212602 RepID=A0A420HNK4_9PEZI|nr:Mitochondrial 37S ribosomal protein S27 [Erysiphe neolycopersici]